MGGALRQPGGTACLSTVCSCTAFHSVPKSDLTVVPHLPLPCLQVPLYELQDGDTLYGVSGELQLGLAAPVPAAHPPLGAAAQSCHTYQNHTPPYPPPMRLRADYGDTEAGLPAVPDMFALFKSQLDQRLAGGRAPLQISTFYEWCVLPGGWQAVSIQRGGQAPMQSSTASMLAASAPTSKTPALSAVQAVGQAGPGPPGRPPVPVLLPSAL